MSELQIMADGKPFQIQYGRGRFPVCQKRPDGSWGCRGCGSAIPKGRQTWCSSSCSEQFNPAEVIWKAKRRDRGICSECGYGCEKEEIKWWNERNHRNANFNYSAWQSRRPRRAEYDHITPFSEGGLTILENIRCLCEDCHKRRTKSWHKTKVILKRKQPEFVL